MPDSLQERVPYAVGYSFKNPRVMQPVTRFREPFFHMNWGVRGPAQVKEEMYQSGQLQRFPTVWRRAAKARTIHKLGAAPLNRREVPSFDELGAAPTEGVPTTVDRGFFGFLNNAITGAGQFVAQQQQLSMAKAQASAMGPTPTLPSSYTPGTGGGLGMMGWSLIGLGGLGAAFYFLKK